MSAIPENDIKIEQIEITASTRKLRARWHLELSPDVIAYHMLDPCMGFMTVASSSGNNVTLINCVSYDEFASDVHMFSSMRVKR